MAFLWFMAGCAIGSALTGALLRAAHSKDLAEISAAVDELIATAKGEKP